MKALLSFLSTPRRRYAFFGCLVFLCALLFMRGCSPHLTVLRPHYKIAVDRSWHPLSLFGKERNMLAFMDELLGEIASEAHFNLHIYIVETASLLRGLDTDAYDAVVSSLTPTNVNRQKYLFSDLLYFTGPVLVVKSSSTINSLGDLQGRYLGIERGMSLSFDVPFPPSVRIVPYDRIASSLADLEQGSIDAMIMDSSQAYVQAHGIYAGKIKVVSQPLIQQGLRLLTLNLPVYDQFMESFNARLEVLKKSGKYTELLSRWALFNPIAHAELVDSPAGQPPG